MAKYFLRNLLLAGGVFLLILLLMQVDWAFTKPFQEYVSFVLNTNFSLRAIANKVPVLQGLAKWDWRSLIQAWPGR